MMLNAKSRPLIGAALLLSSLGITTSCIDNGYDLNKDIDMNISVSGDIFTIPLGYTEETTLSKLIEETETLKLEDGIYSIKKADDIDPVNIDVDAVSIKIDEPSFDGVKVDFDANIDNFTISNKESSSKLNAPKIEVNVNLPKDKSMDTTKPFIASGGSITDHSDFNFKYIKPEWPEEVKTIHSVILKDESGKEYGQKVSFAVTAPAGKMKITNFTVTFPSGFILKDINGKVNGNFITLAKNQIQSTETANYEFYVYGQTLEKERDNGIDINDQITYTFTYTTEATPSSGENIQVQMKSTSFNFDYAMVTTNEIKAEMTDGKVEMKTTVKGLDDVNEVHKITFEDNSPLIVMDIAKDLDLPVDFKSGNLVIEFPSYYNLTLADKSNSGITYANHLLTIPAIAMPDAKVKLKLGSADLTGKPIITENSEKVIKLEDPVKYYLQNNQPMKLQKDKISSKDVAGLETKTLDVFVTGGEMLIANAEVKADAYTAEVEDKTSFEVKEDVDEALSILKTVAWKEGEHPTITLNITFPNFPSDIDKLKFDGLKIQMPKFIKFAASAGVDKDNVLTLNDQFTVKDSYKKVMETVGMDFSYMNGGNGLATKASTTDGKRLLEITDAKETKIDITGNVKTIAGTILNTDKLKDIQVMPVVTIDEMPIGKVTGTVDPVIDPVNEEVDLDLGDDLDFLKDEGNELDIHNPQIMLTLKNTVGVPVDLSLNMYGVDENGNVIETSKVGPVKFQLQPTNADQESKTSMFLLSRQKMQVSESTADTYNENVVVADLYKLMQRVPEKVKFEMTAKANDGKEHHIDLAKDMTITGGYDVIVPLQFEDININYKEEIDELQDDLSDVLDKTTSAELEIHADILNKVPLQMVLSAKAMDTNSSELTTIVTTVFANDKEGGIIAGTLKEGEAAKTPVIIHLKATSSAELKRLDKIELNIHATANETTAGLPLKGEQSIQITNAKVKIKKVNLDLN